MDINLMNAELLRFLRDCEALVVRKNKDYHPDGVGYLEILQTSWETGVTVEQDLWGRLRKQLSALRRFTIEGHVESEPPRQRMIDVSNYMALLAVWTEHKHQILNDAYHFVSQQRPCEHTHSSVLRCVPVSNFADPCDACAFHLWLHSQLTSLDLQAMSSPPTPKPQD